MIAQQTVSGRTQIDGPVEIKDLDKTEENRELMNGFVADVLMGGNPSKIAHYISTETYDQHNPAVGDGLMAFGEAVKGMAEAGMPMVYTKNHFVLGSMDKIIFGSKR